MTAGSPASDEPELLAPWPPAPAPRRRPLLWVSLAVVLLVAVGSLGRAVLVGPRSDGTVVDLATTCTLPDDDPACAAVPTLAQLAEFWDEALPSSDALTYPADAGQYSGRVATGCDLADAELDGSFYCPQEARIYLSEGDVAFLAGSPTFTYVVAHEYAHHVQYLTAFPDAPWITSTDTGPGSLSVRVELQADCYAGVWMAAATGAGYLPEGYADDEALRSDIRSSGDDYGDDTVEAVPEDLWTHGDGETRLAWFDRGYSSGDPDQCNTLAFGAMPTA